MNSLLLRLFAFLSLFAAVVSGCGGHHHHHHHDHDSHNNSHDDHEHEDNSHLPSDEQRELQLVTTNFLLDYWHSEQEFRDAGGRCSTHDPTPAEMRYVNEAVENWQNMKRLGFPGRSRLLQQTTKVIRTHFHIIQRDDGTFDGLPFNAQASVDVLNDAFFGYGATAAFRFELTTIAGPHRNTAWYEAGIAQSSTDPEAVMKRTLRIGGPSDLNVYLTSGAGYLGW